MSSHSFKEITIKQITPTEEHWFVKCQIIRYWPECKIIHQEHVQYAQMIFIDSEGTKIQAAMNEEIHQTEELHIDPDKIYKIQNVYVLENIGQHRMTNHKDMLLLKKETIIQVLSNNKYTTLGLTPVPIRDVLPLKNHIDYLIDIVGVITARSGPREIVIDGEKVKQLILEITDDTGSLEFVLNGCYAYDGLQYLIHGEAATPTIAIQFARVLPHNPIVYGEVAIETFQHSTNVLYDPPFNDMPSIKQRLADCRLLEWNARYVPIPKKDTATSSQPKSK